EALAGEFGLSRAEIDAVQAKDPRRLMDLGVHQYYVPQILRLFFGAAQNSNASAALECYTRAFPEETAKALALQARLETTVSPARRERSWRWPRSSPPWPWRPRPASPAGSTP